MRTSLHRSARTDDRDVNRSAGCSMPRCLDASMEMDKPTRSSDVNRKPLESESWAWLPWLVDRLAIVKGSKG